MAKNSLGVRKSLNFRPQTSVPPNPEEGDIYRDEFTDKLLHYKYEEWREFDIKSRFVDYIDFSQSSLPATTATQIDGNTIVTGDLVIFDSLSADNQKIYEAEVTGVNIVWTARPLFDGGEDPAKGEIFRVLEGTAGELKQYVWDGSNWKDDSAGIIGPAEDSDYADGLFVDFTPLTKTGVAVDRFNEILKELCPKPAPALSDISMGQTGQQVKLSFGSSNAIAGYSDVGTAAGGSALDINEIFPASGQRRGAFGTSIAIKSGVLADAIPADVDDSYPADAFGDGDKGTLELWINGVKEHEIDLLVFGSGASTNGNGSGFNLSAATPVEFPNGNPLILFKYRTGTWTVASSDQRVGWNYVTVNHNFNATDHWTGFFEWVNDTETTALSASGGSLHDLVMSGSRYLSGVEYYTGGTAQYDVTISNAYRNIYEDIATAISFIGTNGTIPPKAIPNMTFEDDDIALTNEPFTITAPRILNASVAATVNCQHPLKTNLTGAASSSISGLLLDSVSTASTALREYFDTETIRLESVSLAGVNDYDAQADVATGVWDSTESIAASGNDGYKDGLLYYESALRYPTQGANGGNFATIAEGPVGNVDYSALSGDRVAYIKFQNNSGVTKSNFKVLLAGESTTFTTVSSGPSGNAATMEMKFPAGSISTMTGWMDCYNDFATGQWNDGDGCRNATDGAGRALSTDWGITVGTKSIANGEYIIIRLTAASGWTGNINDLQLTWL